MSEHDDDVPELTEGDFARAKPFEEVFPEEYGRWQRRGRCPQWLSPRSYRVACKEIVI